MPSYRQLDQPVGLVALDASRLVVTLAITNTGTVPFVFTAALHTYLAVDDIEQVRAHLRSAGLAEGVVFMRQDDGLGHVRVRSDQP